MGCAGDCARPRKGRSGVSAARALTLRAVVLLGVGAFGAVTLRACERVVAAWSLGPAVQVHPAIRAWDAGRDR